jgi:hypothetical protein
MITARMTMAVNRILVIIAGADAEERCLVYTPYPVDPQTASLPSPEREC